MFWVIHAEDRPGALAERLANFEAHRAYLATAPVKILVSGPLLGEDGETSVGSMFLVEAETRAEVEAFNAGDPFAKTGIWGDVRIHGFLKRQDNR